MGLNGLEWVGIDWNGLECAEMGGNWLEWARVSWDGLEEAVMGCTGL